MSQESPTETKCESITEIRNDRERQREEERQMKTHSTREEQHDCSPGWESNPSRSCASSGRANEPRRRAWCVCWGRWLGSRACWASHVCTLIARVRGFHVERVRDNCASARVCVRSAGSRSKHAGVVPRAPARVSVSRVSVISPTSENARMHAGSESRVCR